MTYQNNSQAPNTGGTTAATRDIVIASITDSGDNTGSNDNDSTPLITSTVTVTPVNDAPSAGDFTITIAEDGTRDFLLTDFSTVFSDPDGDALDSIQITSLETDGSLTYISTGLGVQIGDVVTAANITDLRFTPDPSESGTGYATFTYRASDGTDYSADQALILSDAFTTDEGGYTYQDDVFGTSTPGNASGSYDGTGGQTGGGIEVTVGGGSGAGIPLSGAWTQDIVLTETTLVDITVSYRLIVATEFESNEYADAVLAIDGVRLGNDTSPDSNTSLITLDGDAPLDSGWVTETFQVTLGAGTHELQLGAFVNQSTEAAEVAQVFFDDVVVSGIATSDLNTVTVNVTPASAPPTLTSLDNTTWVEDTDTSAKIIDNDVTLDDIDSDTITQITVQITGNYDGTEDVLAFAGDANFSVGVYDSGTGTLTITSTGASATVAQAEAVLEAITYQNTDTDSPTENTRTLTWTVTDGINANNVVETSDITVTASNDAPDGADNTVATTEDTDHVFTAAEFGFSDVDTGDALSGIVITTLPANGTLYLDSNDSGDFTSGEAITAGTTITAADIAANRLRFEPAADENGTPYTSFTFQVVDDSGAGNNTDTTPNTMTIDVSAVNDAPELDLNSSDGSVATGYNDLFATGGSAVNIVSANTTLDDVDGDDTMTLEIVAACIADGTNERLNFGPIQVQLDGLGNQNFNNVTVGGVLVDIGFNDATKTLTITDDTGNTLTRAEAVAVLEAITYENTSGAPTEASRTFSITANDGTDDSNIAVSTIVVGTDTDGDNVIDSTDLDDDNDGILDVDEVVDVTTITPTAVNVTETTPGAYSYTATGDGDITITIVGGAGGDGNNTLGGDGATVSATFTVNAGDVIEYVVGEGGFGNSSSAGGGGSTGVFINDVLVMVAGGGGGGDNSNGQSGLGGTDTTAGSDGTGTQAGTGGTAGAGGTGNPADSAGGGGINSAGGSGAATGGGAADLDATDGVTFISGGAGAGTGGAGGGGFTAGGGGDSNYSGGGAGYSGGGAAGANGRAGGGGSYINTGYAGFVASSDSITAGAAGATTGGANADGADGSLGITGTVDVSVVTAVTDTDGDGIDNRLDLDSDNDGISDLQESGATSTITAYDTNNDGTISLAEGTAAGGTLNNGVWSFFGADAGAGSSDGTTLLDSDSDGVNNFVDLDSDNDGIADIIEGQATAGYTAFSATDTDGDGVVDNFDSGSGFGGNFDTPQDTDGDGTFDYLDTDSDNDTKLDSAESGLTLSGTDANGDGIDDDASIGATYADPDGVINNPSTGLDNEIGDTSEVAYREFTSLPPELDLDDDDSSTATGNDYTKTIIPTPTGIAVTSIVDSDVTITDPDDTNIESATITLTNAQAGDVLTAPGFPMLGITAAIVGDTISLTGSAPLADYQTALEAIRFSNTNTIVSGVDRIIEFTVNDGDTNSATATTTLDIFGTPTVDALVTASTSPTLTGTWDEADADTNGLEVTINGQVYTLGGALPSDAALSSDGSGNWTLDLSVSGQVLPVNTYDVSVTSTAADTVSMVDDQSTNEVRVITTPEWNITGDTNVTEGNNASYSISLTGAELLSAGENVSIVITAADLGATVNTDTGAFGTAITNAIGARTDIVYTPIDAVSGTLTYTAPSNNPYTADYDASGSNFNDISGGTPITTLGDDASVSQAIGFNFDFYGTTYTDVFIGSNGVVTFGGGSTEYANDDFSASGVIDTTNTDTASGLPGIAAFWTDLNPSDGDSGDIYVSQTTEGGVNVLIVQWDDIVPYNGGAGEGGTFQVVLFEGTNNIEVRYSDVIFDGANDGGASATIGVSDGTTSNFTQHSFDTASSVANSSHITFSQPTVAMPDLDIDLSAVVDAADGPEDYSLTIGTPGGTGTAVLGSDISVTTTIFDIDTPPTIMATPDAGITFTENVDSNVDLFDSVTVETNENDRTVEEVTFSVSGLADGASERLNLDGTSIQLTDGSSGVTTSYTYSVSVTGTTATVTLTTTGASEGDIQTVIDNMSYQNNVAEDPTAGNRVVTIESITDSGDSGLNQTTGIGISATVDVIAVNDAPVVGAPGSELAYPGSTINIHGEGFTVSEVDDRDATVSVTLSVDEGTINVTAGDSGVGSIAGNGTNTVTLTGTIAEVDNFLTGAGTGTITYTAAGSPTTDATFTVTVNDQGNTGIDPSLTGDGSSEEGSNSVTIDTFTEIEFGISATPISISENGSATTTFTLSLDTPVGAGNTASVTLTPGGTATSGTDYTDFLAAVDAGLPSGVTRSGNVLTFDGDIYTGTGFTFDISSIDDVYAEGTETVTVTLSAATIDNGNASIDVGATTQSIDIVDDSDTTTVTLTATNSVAENGTITYTATIDNPVTDTPLNITLDNGTVITIGVGNTTGSNTYNVNDEDAFVDAGNLVASIASTSGGAFENLDTSDSATTTVTDTITDTTVSLTGPASVNEGDTVTITATVDNAPSGGSLVINLDNGQSITIADGATTGTVTFTAQSEDVFIDAETATYAVDTVVNNGTAYENLITTDTVSVNILDTVDDTTVSLTGPASVNEGDTVTITATVDNAPSGGSLVINLDNGQSITIADGATTGTVTFTAQSEDVFIDAETATYAVDTVVNNGTAYENLITTDTVSVNILDTVDDTTVSLTGPASVNEGDTVTITATVDNAPSGGSLVINLDNGQSITIADGATTGTVTFTAQSEDVFIDAETATYAVDTVVNNGTAYENLITTDTVSVNILDTVDDKTVS